MTKTVETLIHLSETQKFLHGRASVVSTAVKTPAQLSSPGTYFLWIPTVIPYRKKACSNIHYFGKKQKYNFGLILSLLRKDRDNSNKQQQRQACVGF